MFKRNRIDPVIEVPLVGSAAVDLNNDSPSAIRRSISFTSSAAAPTAPTAAVDGDTDDNNAVAVAAAAAAADIEMGVKSLRVLVVDDSSANRSGYTSSSVAELLSIYYCTYLPSFFAGR